MTNRTPIEDPPKAA